MIATVDREKAMELLEQAVQLKGPDYIDPGSSESSTASCTYFVGEQPSCIVGHVLAKFDLNRTFDNEEIQLLIEPWIDGHAPFEAPDEDYYSGGYLANNRDFTLTSGAVTVLRAAQSAQDSGHTWGTALDRSREASDNFEKSGYGV
jgi:hypothetical protein